LKITPGGGVFGYFYPMLRGSGGWGNPPFATGQLLGVAVLNFFAPVTKKIKEICTDIAAVKAGLLHEVRAAHQQQ